LEREESLARREGGLGTLSPLGCTPGRHCQNVFPLFSEGLLARTFLRIIKLQLSKKTKKQKKTHTIGTKSVNWQYLERKCIFFFFSL